MTNLPSLYIKKIYCYISINLLSFIYKSTVSCIYKSNLPQAVSPPPLVRVMVIKLAFFLLAANYLVNIDLIVSKNSTIGNPLALERIFIMDFAMLLVKKLYLWLGKWTRVHKQTSIFFKYLWRAENKALYATKSLPQQC